MLAQEVVATDIKNGQRGAMRQQFRQLIHNCTRWQDAFTFAATDIENIHVANEVVVFTCVPLGSPVHKLIQKNSAHTWSEVANNTTVAAANNGA